jgi:hypothetical protein
VERSCFPDAVGRKGWQPTASGLLAGDRPTAFIRRALRRSFLGLRGGRWLPVRCGYPSWPRPYTRRSPWIHRCKMRRVRDLWAPTVVLIGLVGREGRGPRRSTTSSAELLVGSEGNGARGNRFCIERRGTWISVPSRSA